MKNFLKFQSAYEALKEARQAAFRFSAERVSPYFEDEFHANRRNISDNIDIAIDALLDWFDENFPRTTMDAAQSDCFSYPAFFAMLKKHPELVESNEDNLAMLLAGLKAKGLYGTGLSTFPSIDEFISEKMKLKDGKVTEARRALSQIDEAGVKKEVEGIKDVLALRRPKTRMAYFAILKLRNGAWHDDTLDHLAVACAALDAV